jgi:hypothetical protein
MERSYGLCSFTKQLSTDSDRIIGNRDYGNGENSIGKWESDGAGYVRNRFDLWYKRSASVRTHQTGSIYSGFPENACISGLFENREPVRSLVQTNAEHSYLQTDSLFLVTQHIGI